MARRVRRARAVVDIRALGFPELQSKLNNLTNTLGKQVVRAAMKKSMTKVMKPAAKASLVKVSKMGETLTEGRSKNRLERMKSLPVKVTVGRNTKKRPVTFRVAVVSPDRYLMGHNPKEAYLPALLEAGVGPRRTKSGNPMKAIAPQRMFRRTRDQKSGTLKGRLSQMIARGIEDKVKKLGKRKAFR